MSYTGRCACGHVTLAIAGEAIQTRQCWCGQCQRIAGGGPTHNVIFRDEQITLVGRLASHGYVAASGSTMVTWYCPACGSPLCAQSTARPQFRAVRLGALDTPHGLAPQLAIWTDEAPDWAVIDPALERHRQQPSTAIATD